MMQGRWRGSLRGLLIPVLLILGNMAFGQPSHGAEPREDEPAVVTDRKLERIDELVRKEKYAVAKRRAEGYAWELVDSLNGGPNDALLLARICTLRALAHQGLGEEDEALWFWDLAWTFDPHLGEGSPDPYGEVGRRLWAVPHRSKAPRLAGEEGEGSSIRQPASDAVRDATIPPKVVQRTVPRYPLGTRSAGVERAVMVQVVVDDTGRIHSPSVLNAIQHPAETFAAFHTVRQWTFRPGTVEGKPVETIYNLVINFHFASAGQWQGG